MANENHPFNPYHKLLGIPKESTPPDHYTLLGVTLFESDPEVINNAADGRMMFLRSFQTGRYADVVQRVLNEVSAARVCLLNEDSRNAYDKELHAKLPTVGTPTVSPTLVHGTVLPVGTLVSPPVPPRIPNIPAPPPPKPPVQNAMGVTLFETEIRPAPTGKTSAGKTSSGKNPAGKTAGPTVFGRKKKRWKFLILGIGILAGFLCAAYFSGKGNDIIAKLRPVSRLRKTTTRDETAQTKTADAPSPEEIARLQQEAEAMRLLTASTLRHPGQRVTKILNGVEYAFHWCPPGEFLMGSPPKEKGRENGTQRETQHKVTLTRGFWILEGEVTQEMWQSALGNNPSEPKFTSPKLPVTNVSWNNCQEFCQKLTAILGYAVQLPTEAQWEYACRAGTTGPFYLAKMEEACWCRKNGHHRPHETGGRTANAWGLHDMHGNVAEWCWDWFAPYPQEAIQDPTGPENPTHGNIRILRGGAYTEKQAECRSASRNGNEPQNCFGHVGFRIVVVPAP